MEGTLFYEQYRKMQSLTKIFVTAMDSGYSKIAWDAFQELRTLGVPYETQSGKVCVHLDGKTYTMQENPEGDMQEQTDHERQSEVSQQAPVDWETEQAILSWQQPDLTPDPVQPLISPQAAEASMQKAASASPTPDLRDLFGEEGASEKMFREDINDGWGVPKEEPAAMDFLSDFNKELNALAQAFPSEGSTDKGASAAISPIPADAAPPAKPAETVQPQSDLMNALQELDNIVGFGRSDAAVPPARRFMSHKEETAQTDDAKQGFLPPLTSDFTPNYEIALKDCVYSMFSGEIYGETSLRKHNIYFMIAPFELEENTPSTNILFYAYFNGENYATTSLKNPDKNSLICQVGEYQFLVRGKFTDGKWAAQIQLTGKSLQRKDVFEIKRTYHNNPETLGQTNGHIRFRYQGYMNRKDLISTGCINIFPIDVSSGAFVIIRCIEDFIDTFYTDDVDYVTLYTSEGKKNLTISLEDKVAHAYLADAPEEEEGEFHE